MKDFLFSFLLPLTVTAQITSGNTLAVIASVEKHQQELIRLSDPGWGFAETAIKATKSAKV